MSPLTASRLMRAHVEVATNGARYRERRMTRRERKATARMLWLVACGVAYFGWRTLA